MATFLATTGISVTADTQIKAGGGFINNLIINNVTTGGVITLYDSLSKTGTIIFQTTLAISNTPIVLPLERGFQIGLFVGFDATLVGRVSVSYA